MNHSWVSKLPMHGASPRQAAIQGRSTFIKVTPKSPKKKKQKQRLVKFNFKLQKYDRRKIANIKQNK